MTQLLQGTRAKYSNYQLIPGQASMWVGPSRQLQGVGPHQGRDTFGRECSYHWLYNLEGKHLWRNRKTRMERQAFLGKAAGPEKNLK